MGFNTKETDTQADHVKDGSEAEARKRSKLWEEKEYNNI